MYLVFWGFFLFLFKKIPKLPRNRKIMGYFNFFINIHAKFKKGQMIGSYEEPWHIKYENRKMNTVRKTKFLLT